MITPQTWGSYWDYFGEHLVDVARPHGGASVLDVGTGGGSTLYPAALDVGPSGHVTGIDMFFPSVMVTSAEIKRCGFSNADMLMMDARNMGFADESFDLMISGFIGWDDWFDFATCKHIAEDRIMEATWRILKKGGRAAISGWVVQEDTEKFRAILADYLSERASDPTTDKVRLPLMYSKENDKGWKIIMSSAGFKKMKTLTLTGSFTDEDADAQWKRMMRSGWGYHLSGLKRSQGLDLKDLKKYAVDEIVGLKGLGAIGYERTVVFALGEK
jgi:ubiquinone/menaquinone biosynthesis C-methylase UbiE